MKVDSVVSIDSKFFFFVAVPLQERGQFISIWVRIVTEVVDEKIKILVSIIFYFLLNKLI